MWDSWWTSALGYVHVSVLQSSHVSIMPLLLHIHSSMKDIQKEYHCLTLSYSMTRPQQRFQSYNKIFQYSLTFWITCFIWVMENWPMSGPFLYRQSHPSITTKKKKTSGYAVNSLHKIWHHTIQKNKTTLDANKNVGTEVNEEKLCIYLHLINQDYNVRIADKSPENIT
jgi:hypothetical protein